MDTGPLIRVPSCYMRKFLHVAMGPSPGLYVPMFIHHDGQALLISHSHSTDVTIATSSSNVFEARHCPLWMTCSLFPPPRRMSRDIVRCGCIPFIFHIYSVYIPCIFRIYSVYIPYIFHIYSIYISSYNTRYFSTKHTYFTMQYKI